MYNVTLEELTTFTGAQDFHKLLGLRGKCIVPPPKNQNQAKPSEHLIKQVSEIVDKIKVDMPKLVEDSIKQGFSFDTT